MPDSNLSYWEEQWADEPYDLVVIGAGIVGLSGALLYKRKHRDKRVLVLERGSLPRGASTRNAGFACVGSITEHMADLEKTSEQQVKERISKRYEGLELLKKKLGKEKIGYDPCGGYELFISEEAFGNASENIEQFNNWLEELTGEPGVYSAGRLNGYPVIRNRLEGALNPGKLIRELVRRVTRTGAEIRWNCEVRRIRGGNVIEAADGRKYRAGKLLIATNAFTGHLVPRVDIRPARGYVMVTSELEQMDWRGTFHHDRGYVYFRDIGRRLLLGGARNIAEKEEETDSFGINERVKQHLVSFADDVLHLPSGWKIDREWSGIMGFTNSKNPVVKVIDDDCVLAAGLSGMGIAIGMKVAEEAVELLHK